jgi:hypothetical protein
MQILDKQRFLNAMLELFRSVDHISCVGSEKNEGDSEVAFCTEDFIQAFKAYELKRGDNPTDRQIEYAEQWIREWITNGPLFIMFNQDGLMAEVNQYLIDMDGARDASCSCGENDACPQCAGVK